MVVLREAGVQWPEAVHPAKGYRAGEAGVRGRLSPRLHPQAALVPRGGARAESG